MTNRLRTSLLGQFTGRFFRVMGEVGVVAEKANNNRNPGWLGGAVIASNTPFCCLKMPTKSSWNKKSNGTVLIATGDFGRDPLEQTTCMPS